MSRGFSVIALLIILTFIGLAMLGIYLKNNYDFAFNIYPKAITSSPNNEKTFEEIPITNLQNMTCGYIGFATGTLSEYSIFSHPNLYKYGKENYAEKLGMENTEKVKQALRQVMNQIPPEHNPTISICFTDNDKFILINDKQVNLLHLDSEYKVLKIISLNDFMPIYDFLAYSNDQILYIKQSSKDYSNGKMKDGVLKVNLKDGSKKLINYSEHTESIGVPQKTATQTTMTSKNLGITFTSPAGVEATYNPLFDQAIEFFYFRKGEDELEISLGKNPYCTPSTPGYFRDIQKITVANKWQIDKVRSDDPRDAQTKWGGQVVADDGVCIGFKETINKDPEMEKVFDEILTTAKVN